MAVIKVVNSKASLNKTIDYVTKEEKTEELLISGKDCTPQTVKLEMQSTKQMYNKLGGRQYKHYVQSFKKNENITPEQAHVIAKEWASKNFKNHEVLIATHKDREHIHSHFVVNSVNFKNGRKFQESAKDLQKLKDHSNELSKKHGLTVPTQSKNVTSYDQKKYRVLEKALKEGKPSQLVETAQAVSNAQIQATHKDHFVKLMNDQGYQVRYQDNRKHITFTHPKGRKFRNTNLSKTLHRDYSKEALENGFQRVRGQKNRENTGIRTNRDTTSNTVNPSITGINPTQRPIAELPGSSGRQTESIQNQHQQRPRNADFDFDKTKRNLESARKSVAAESRNQEFRTKANQRLDNIGVKPSRKDNSQELSTNSREQRQAEQRTDQQSIKSNDNDRREIERTPQRIKRQNKSISR